MWREEAGSGDWQVTGLLGPLLGRWGITRRVQWKRLNAAEVKKGGLDSCRHDNALMFENNLCALLWHKKKTKKKRQKKHSLDLLL